MNNKDEITATRMNLDAHGGSVARTLAVSAAVLFTILLVLQAQSQLTRKPPVTGTMLIEYDTLAVEKPATRPLLAGPVDDPQSCPD
jgi:hypothetical protein